MRWDSFRVRLTLWNMAILALVLGGFGLAFCLAIQSSMGRSIDQDLMERVQRDRDWKRGYRLRRGPGGWGGRPGRFDRRGRGEGAPGPREGRPNSFRGGRIEPGAGPPPPGPPGPRPSEPSLGGLPISGPYDAEAQRRASLQFPRSVDEAGKPWAPRGAPVPAWAPDAIAAALAGREHFSTVIVEGDRVRLLSAPIYDEAGRIVGAVQVAADLRSFDRLWRGQMGTLLALLPLSLLVAGLGGLFLTNRALRPVHEVTAAAAQIGVEDLSRRLKVRGRDELAELAATFNGMIGRLEAAFEQQRRFTADASHELRTPLARIKVSTSMALAGEQSPEEYRTALRVADQAADVMERLIQQLMILARADAGQLPIERVRLDLRDVLHEAVDGVSGTPSAPIGLDLPAEPVEIAGDPDHLHRVFLNLLQNAIRHTPAAGRITLSARAAGGTAVVRVSDTGEGIAPEHLPHLGERFYRVDSARNRRTGGTGLGLAISRTIVQAHGGQLSIESEPGQGTIVTVSLPRGGLLDQASR
jgi:two-component system, OmpR family, sensor kinase